MTKENIQAGSSGAGLVPYDPEVVISKLDIRLSTPIPENSRPSTSHSWVSKTPQTTNDATQQTNLIKKRIKRQYRSSPAPILEAIDLFAKGTAKVMHEQVMHEFVLLKAENKRL